MQHDLPVLVIGITTAWLLQRFVPAIRQVADRRVARWVDRLAFVLLALAVAAVLPFRSDDDRRSTPSTLPVRPPGPTTTAPVLNDPLAAEPVTIRHDTTIHTDVGVGPVVADGNELWTWSFLEQTVDIFDGETGGHLSHLSLPFRPWEVSFVRGEAWVTGFGHTAKIERTTRGLSVRPDDRPNPGPLVDDGTALWTSAYDASSSEALKLDPTTMHATGRTALPGRPNDVAYGYGQVWVSTDDVAGRGELITIDPKTTAVTSVVDVGGGGALRFVANTTWLFQDTKHRILRLDPKEHAITSSIPTDRIQGEVVAGNLLWVLDIVDRTGECTIKEIQPSSGLIVSQIAAGANCNSIAATRDSLWVLSASGDDARLDRFKVGEPIKH